MSETEKSDALDAMLDVAIRDARAEESFSGTNVRYGFGSHAGRWEEMVPSDCEADKIRATVRHLVLDRGLPMPKQVRLIMLWHTIRLRYENVILDQMDHDGNWCLGSPDRREILRTRLETSAELSAVIQLIADSESKGKE